MLNFKVDEEKCIRCGVCVAECPTRIIKFSENNNIPEIAADAETSCMQCEHCFAICPTGAVSIFDLDPKRDGIELDVNILPTAENMEALVRGRRSIRHYLQKNVDRQLLDHILQATFNAPTAVNNSALRFDVIADIESMNAIRSGIMADLIAYTDEKELPPACAYLNNAIKPWANHGVDVIFRTAPHALIVSATANNHFSNIVDVTIALSYFEFLAQANGIGTVWCGMLKQCLELFPKYKEKLIQPGGGDYYCMLFGYPDINFARTVKRERLAKIRYL